MIIFRKPSTVNKKEMFYSYLHYLKSQIYYFSDCFRSGLICYRSFISTVLAFGYVRVLSIHGEPKASGI